MEAPPLPVAVGSPPKQNSKRSIHQLSMTKDRVKVREAPTLNHKIADNAVKLGAIIVTPPGKFGKVAASVWSVLPVQLDNNLAHP